MEQLGCHWTDFNEIWYLSVFRKAVETALDRKHICTPVNSSFIKIGQEWLALCEKTNIQFWSYLAPFSLEWEMCQTKVVENVKDILCPIPFFFRKRCHLWDNVEKCTPGRPQMTIWHMRIVCWIPKSTNTHTQYMQHVLLSHCNNGSTNTPKCYVICTLPVLFAITVTRILICKWYQLSLNTPLGTGLYFTFHPPPEINWVI
jgi:hypothetical protein